MTYFKDCLEISFELVRQYPTDEKREELKVIGEEAKKYYNPLFTELKRLNEHSLYYNTLTS